MNRTSIFNRIIDKGGIIGATAKIYFGDDKKMDEFIKECRDQCHNKAAKQFWGEELAQEIEKYVEVELGM